MTTISIFNLFTVMSFFLTLGVVLDALLVQSKKESLAESLQRKLPTSSGWYAEVNEDFQLVFDRLYGYGDTLKERLVWLGILGAYVVLFVARVVLWWFDVPMPDTSLVLVSAIFVSTAAVLLSYGAFGSKDVVDVCTSIEERLRVADGKGKERMARLFVVSVFAGLGTATIAVTATMDVIRPVALVGLCLLASLALPPVAVGVLPESLYPVEPTPGRPQAVKCGVVSIIGITLYVGAAAGATIKMGGDVLLILAMAVGMTVAAPFAYVPFKIQRRLDTVNPILAMVSSLVFVTVVGATFRDAGAAFVTEIYASGFVSLSFLAFNVFADSVSLIETKWLLKKSKKLPGLLLPLALLADLVLSGAIYLLLPVFVGQEIHVFIEAIRFSGSAPWMGVLFWSTFSTSIIFYFFVVAVLVLQILAQTRLFEVIDEAFTVQENPAAVIFLMVDALVVVLYVAYKLYSYAPG